MNIGFNQRFVVKLRRGHKTQTVRQGDRWRAGLRMDLWENFRGALNGPHPQRLIFRVFVTGVRPVEIQFGAVLKVKLDGLDLTASELELFAREDGFENSDQMRMFFSDYYPKNRGVLRGQVIYWNFAERFTVCLMMKRPIRKRRPYGMTAELSEEPTTQAPRLDSVTKFCGRSVDVDVRGVTGKLRSPFHPDQSR